MKKMLIRMAMPFLVKAITKELLPALQKVVDKSDNKLDDKAMKLVVQAIVTWSKSV